MGHLFSYALSVAIYLIMGYLMYKVFLAGARQQTFNRIAIYAITGLSLMMPLVAGIYSSFHTVSMPHNAMEGTVDFELIPGGVIREDSPSILPALVIVIYVLGMLVTALWMLISILQIVRILRKGEEIDISVNDISATITVVDDDRIAPFSWMGHLVMSRADYEGDNLAIIEHEVGHIRNGHSYDMMGYMFLLVFQWFNPAAWLIVEELRTVHEYQADEAVIASGADIKAYQTMLIKKAVGTRFPSPANSLNHSNLKKRITMMYKSNPKAVRKAALLMAVPAMVLAMFVTHIPAIASVLSDIGSTTLNQVSRYVDSGNKVSKNLSDLKITESEMKEDANQPESKNLNFSEVPTKEGIAKAVEKDNQINDGSIAYSEEVSKSEPEKILASAQVLAEYPGGTPAMMQYLANNIRYPESAKESSIQGRVIVRFVIEKDGKVSDPKIMRGVSDELDAEALRVVGNMPNWKPAEEDGKVVASYFTIPVSFK